MLRLVFESETVELLLPNVPGRCRAGGKNHECGTGQEEIVECAKLGCLTHLYNILHEQYNFLARTLCAQRLGCQNTISIVITLEFWKRSFFGRGECSPTHSELSRFVSGSHAKHQLSSLVITLSRKFLSLLIMFNRSWHAATRSSICSRVSACGTNLEQSFRFFKSFFKIRRSPVFGMPSASAINRNVTFRSS